MERFSRVRVSHNQLTSLGRFRTTAKGAYNLFDRLSIVSINMREKDEDEEKLKVRQVLPYPPLPRPRFFLSFFLSMCRSVFLTFCSTRNPKNIITNESADLEIRTPQKNAGSRHPKRR